MNSSIDCLPIHYKSLMKLSKTNFYPPICRGPVDPMEVYGEIAKSGIEDSCYKSCTVFQYSGKAQKLFGEISHSKQVIIEYWFSADYIEVNEEKRWIRLIEKYSSVFSVKPKIRISVFGLQQDFFHIFLQY